MKSSWFFFLFASLFSKSYCSIAINIGSQPSSLLKSAFNPLAKWQMKHFLTKEPFVAYSKINDGTLELFGTAFGNEVTREMIMFLQEIVSNFNIHSVAFKWFYFDEKMLRIFDVLDEKLQISVKSVTFERCYFPETFIFKDSFELNRVTNCFFINCFANEESFKEIFKIFKNAPVISLTISRVLDYKQDESIGTNVALKKLVTRNVTKRLLRIDLLELNLFFPNIKFLSLSYSSLDFDHFSLTSLKTLNSVDLNKVSFKNLRVQKIFECLPTNAKCIAISDSDSYNNSSFIKNASMKKIIVDNWCPIAGCEIKCVEVFSVFSSFYFSMIWMNDKMTAIKEYVESNGVINTVTSVKFILVFDYKSIENMMTLLSYFPNVDHVDICFINSCDESVDDDQIHQLFPALPIKSVKKLTIFYFQNEESSAFYRFVVELMKMCQNMSSLEFFYSKSNSFATKIKEIVDRENIPLTNLDSFTVNYCSDDTCIAIDLFYVAKYNIKNLTMDMKGSLQNLDGLEKYKYFSVVNVKFYIWNVYNDEDFDSFFAKFPYVTNFSWHPPYQKLFSINALQNMKRLKKVIVRDGIFSYDFSKLLLLLPNDLESLEITCSSCKIREIEAGFYEKFPTATLTMNTLQLKL